MLGGGRGPVVRSTGRIGGDLPDVGIAVAEARVEGEFQGPRRGVPAVMDLRSARIQDLLGITCVTDDSDVERSRYTGMVEEQFDEQSSVSISRSEERLGERVEIEDISSVLAQNLAPSVTICRLVGQEWQEVLVFGPRSMSSWVCSCRWELARAWVSR